MRILQINTVVNFNATGRIADELGNLILSRGGESYIAYGRNKRESQSVLIKTGSNLSIRFHVLLSRLFDKHGAGSRQATRNLIKQIKEIKPDIIHLHNVHGYYLNLAILFEFLAKSEVPIVWTLHDCWALTGHCAYFDFVGCQKWKTKCHSCPQLKQYPKSWMVDGSSRNFLEKKQLYAPLKNLTIVTVSNWHASIVKESILNSHPLRVIHNGLDLNVFRRSTETRLIKQKLNIPDDAFLLLGVASVWEPRKGLQDFLKLSKMLDEKTILVLVGLNAAQLKMLPKNIVGIARTENLKELVDLYSCADLFLNLTYEDNFPTTNLEALACGTPVLTYATGGSIESVTPETGFILEKGDLEGVLDAIETIRKTNKEGYLASCRSSAEKYFNNQDCYRSYFQLYESLV